MIVWVMFRALGPRGAELPRCAFKRGRSHPHRTVRFPQPRRRLPVLVDREGKGTAPVPPAPRMTPVALPVAAPEPPAAADDDDAAPRVVAATPRNRIILADGVMPILKPPPVTVRAVKVEPLAGAPEQHPPIAPRRPWVWPEPRPFRC